MIIRRVSGHSLNELTEGTLVFACRVMPPKIGDFVIAKTAKREVIKKVTEIKEDKFYLAGKDAQHDAGWVDRKIIKGKVIWPRVK